MSKNIIYVFIDASNLWQSQKAKGKFLDYKKTVEYLKSRFKASEVKVFYYTAYPAKGTRNYSLSGKHRFFTFLKKGLGFQVRKKELKRINITTAEGPTIMEKGNMDVEIAVDAMHHIKKYQTAVFFTGDSDFLVLVSYLMNRGKKVYIYSSRNNISSELRTTNNGYTDILKLENIWGEKLKHKEQK